MGWRGSRCGRRGWGVGLGLGGGGWGWGGACKSVLGAGDSQTSRHATADGHTRLVHSYHGARQPYLIKTQNWRNKSSRALASKPRAASHITYRCIDRTRTGGTALALSWRQARHVSRCLAAHTHQTSDMSISSSRRRPFTMPWFPPPLTTATACTFPFPFKR